MRSVQQRTPRHPRSSRRLSRAEGLPARPATARYLLAALPEESDEPRFEFSATTRWRAVLDFDPSWALAESRLGRSPDPLQFIADQPWWPTTSREGVEALSRLWRHSAAVALAARRLAREANDPDPEAVARAGMLHGLGRWAIAALDPEWLARWFALEDVQERRALEVRELGVELHCLGRTLSERWGCEPLIADAAWLHDLAVPVDVPTVAEPARVGFIREAYRLAEETPWALYQAGPRPVVSHDPRVKLLTAEVQCRCTSLFVDVSDNIREEALTRSNARLRLRLEGLATEHAARGRFLEFLASSRPSDDEDALAERASLAWCGTAGVTAARVDWNDRTVGPDSSIPSTGIDRPPNRELSLSHHGQTLARVRLWGDPATLSAWAPDRELAAAWSSWAAGVVDRKRLQERLNAAMQAFRHNAASAEPRLRDAKLDALAEFAAGAGHELNNPLAVIVGRAQLLMGRSDDPDVTRSLRAILTQAQRAHRILRDLMYVGRASTRVMPRFCQPDEIVRSCLRDAKDEADARDVRLVMDASEVPRRVWTDADALRQVADSLVRNALESSPRGAQIRFSTRGDTAALRWTVEDDGRGITPEEGEHLFDPFYCGRQAGRGLGMGLPRLARFLGQIGGDVRVHSAPGQGSVFQARVPLTPPPKPRSTEPEFAGIPSPAGASRPATA